MSLPSGIVARWIRAVKLEASNCIIASIHERDTEGSATTELSVDMLVVTQVLNQFFNIHRLFVGIEMSLAIQSAIVNEEVSICNYT